MSKRGQFNINSFPLIVKYANIDPNTEPDYLCDASNIPVENDYFDGVICAEVLEHVKNPIEILEESFRVLKPKGEIFVTIPFHFRIHTDPADYARYTDTYLRELFKQVGFINITIEKQGGFSCVLFDMIRSWIYIMKIERKKRILCNILSIIMSFAKKRVIEIDVQEDNKYNELFTSYTTGYGIVAIKPMIEMNANKKGF